MSNKCVQSCARGQIETSLLEAGEVVKTQSKEFEKEKVVPEQYSKIGVSREFTKNLGNYQSVKGGVWVEVPCGVSKDELREAYLEAGTMIANYAAEELQDAIEWSREVGLTNG